MKMNLKTKVELAFPKHVDSKKNLSIDEMMERCLKWYPNCEWKISNLLMKDTGNELVPYYFALFGKKTYHGEDEHWEPAYIDKDGKCYFESSLASSTGELNQIAADFLNKECFECAYYEYEGTVESVVNFVYNGIEGRRK